MIVRRRIDAMAEDFLFAPWLRPGALRGGLFTDGSQGAAEFSSTRSSSEATSGAIMGTIIVSGDGVDLGSYGKWRKRLVGRAGVRG